MKGVSKMRKPKYLVVVESRTLGKTITGFNSEEKAKDRYEYEKYCCGDCTSISVRLLKAKGRV